MTTAAPTLTGRVLLLTSDGDAVSDVEAELRAAGYDVRRCVDDDAAPYPCNGLRDGCPLDVDGGVDVVLDVRRDPFAPPTLREVGVVCAQRSKVPVAVVDVRAEDVVGACERAIDAGLDDARRAMSEAVRSVLAVHGIDGSPSSVAVTKRLGDVRVTITVDAPPSVRGMAATRAAAALRRLDDRSTSVEIDVVSPG